MNIENQEKQYSSGYDIDCSKIGENMDNLINNQIMSGGVDGADMKIEYYNS